VRRAPGRPTRHCFASTSSSEHGTRTCGRSSTGCVAASERAT
jgi:hypothetical protein